MSAIEGTWDNPQGFAASHDFHFTHLVHNVILLRFFFHVLRTVYLHSILRYELQLICSLKATLRCFQENIRNEKGCDLCTLCAGQEKRKP